MLYARIMLIMLARVSLVASGEGGEEEAAANAAARAGGESGRVRRGHGGRDWAATGGLVVDRRVWVGMGDAIP